MSIKDAYDFDFLVNEAERLVLDELEEQLGKDTENKICKCQDCILDMAAYALNNVRPVYRASLLGKLYSDAIGGTEYEEEITAAVEAAIEKVSKNPMHD
jgi:competence protein ComFB